jgi:Sulfotransferase family
MALFRSSRRSTGEISPGPGNHPIPAARACFDHWLMQSLAPATDATVSAAGWHFYPRALDLADWLAAVFGGASRALSAGELVERAQRRTGLSDFGEEPFEEPLRVLVESFEREACLSAFGKMAARWDMLRFLSNLLMLREAEKRRPGILQRPVEQPVFITGLPRSGTTFLHHLFAQDSSNRFVQCWETIYPCAGTSRRAAPDRRANKVDRQLSGFARLAPELRRVHPIGANSPQECTEITAHVFRSLRFDTTHNVPGYRRWLDQAGHLAGYRFHRRFLRHMQDDAAPGRWVLKSPDHVFALSAIRAVYPDARFIFMHRDPLEVLPSVAKLTEVLRAPFTRALDRHAIGAQVAEGWARGAAILVEEGRSDNPLSAHIQFRRLVGDPLGTLRSLYGWLGLQLSAETEARFRAAISAWPQGKHRGGKTQLEDYGLTANSVCGQYGAYRATFCV